MSSSGSNRRRSDALWSAKSPASKLSTLLRSGHSDGVIRELTGVTLPGIGYSQCFKNGAGVAPKPLAQGSTAVEADASVEIYPRNNEGLVYEPIAQIRTSSADSHRELQEIGTHAIHLYIAVNNF